MIRWIYNNQLKQFGLDDPQEKLLGVHGICSRIGYGLFESL